MENLTTLQLLQPFMQNGGGPGAAQNGFTKRDGLEYPVYTANNLVSNATMIPDNWYRFEIDLDWNNHIVQNARLYQIQDGNLGLPWAMGALEEFQQRGEPKLRFYFNSDTFTWYEQLARIGFRYTSFAGDPGTEYAVFDNFKITECVGVTGTVILQDHTLLPLDNERVIVELRQGATVVDRQAITPDSDGNFKFNTDQLGTFDVAIKGSHWLQVVVPNVVINSFGGSFGTVFQINGDVDGDNEVIIVDVGLMSTAFGSDGGEPGFSPPSFGWNYNADLDRDNEVNIVDAGIIAANFGQSGDE